MFYLVSAVDSKIVDPKTVCFFVDQAYKPILNYQELTCVNLALKYRILHPLTVVLARF